ncbi:exopolysaccharide biosynthesis polyprenyl glycosylphosphotransferase [Methylosinus sp. PW1]|uniref:exopolysaccharide biosynthesis polyprenyl glycosylphosphotransferase n=1 Tax=Methylosinus sp. PW1 TaxID=107636 RepID=UPI0005605B74|nr:exopolysaccharide biosynthesis polyprenyl glycosylphosphotransferase [Methylosinus sp. PW1]
MGLDFCDSRGIVRSRGATRRSKRILPYNVAAGFAVFDAACLVLIGLACAGYSGASGEFSVWSPQEWQIWAVLFAAALQFGLAHIFEVYRTAKILDRRHILRRMALSFLCTFGFMIGIAAATKSAETYSRLWFFSWAAASTMAAIVARGTVLRGIRVSLAERTFVHRALSVGVFCDPLHPREIERQTRNEEFVVGIGKFDELTELVELSDRIVQDEIDHVYLAAPWDKIPTVLRHLELLRHLSTRVFVLPADRRILADVVGVSKFGDRVSFCGMKEPIQGWSLWFKRLEDIILAGCALVALSPLFALTALAIRVDSPGPIFFRQLRVGFNGRTFRVWKFRSMYVEKTDPDASVQTSRLDPRVTRVGRLIRRLSIDELPQLFNVIQGDMSIVGPRPHALATRTEGCNLDELIDYYAVRHRVKPGMTGWAQVQGFRGELDTQEKLRNRVDCDIYYIDNWTLWLDIDIIFRTMMIVLRDSRAY